MYFLLFYLVFYSHTELHSLQGMEFLEGFGKKKQQPHQQLNNLSSIRINPLSAQSLNIHLHGILFLILIFLIFICQTLFRFYPIIALLRIVTCHMLHIIMLIKNNLNIVIISFLALFAAVEHGHVDKARTILESTDVDVNR